MRGVQDFIGEVFWRPLVGVWLSLASLVGVLAWIGIGDHWTVGTKTLVVVTILLFALLTRVFYIAYPLYMKVDQLHMKVDQLRMKVDQPLSVRKVLPGKHSLKDNVLVILERRDAVSVGDILTLFVREGDAEIPVCLILVETTTSIGFPQSVVLRSLTDESLLEYLSDESRIEQLQAKRSVKKEHLEWLMTP